MKNNEKYREHEKDINRSHARTKIKPLTDTLTHTHTHTLTHTLKHSHTHTHTQVAVRSVGVNYSRAFSKAETAR